MAAYGSAGGESVMKIIIMSREKMIIVKYNKENGESNNVDKNKMSSKAAKLAASSEMKIEINVNNGIANLSVMS